MTYRRRRIGCWSFIALGLVAGAAAWAAEPAGPLLYVVEGDQLVFTNTPSAAARPVPGLEPWRPARPAAKNGLPVTIYDPFIERVAHENGLSSSLIKAVALVESGFNAHAVSPKGAQGLMQLMPGTARRYGVDDALDPLQNLRAGSAHLRDLLDQFDGNLGLALAAYNAGATAVRRQGGIPAYRETQRYVQQVQQHMGAAARGKSRRGTGRRETGPENIRLLPQANGSVLLSN